MTTRHSTSPPGAPSTLLRLLEPTPMMRVDKVSLIRREVREFLSPSALEVLFARADVVVEGGPAQGGPAGSRTYATIMTTLDLARCSAMFREPADAATAARLVELMRASSELGPRLIATAMSDLVRLTGRSEHELDIAIDIEIRQDGVTILLDGDLTVQVRPMIQRQR